jgi:ribonucleotide reductase alpha subunit
MRVIKRNGAYEEISFDKVLKRIRTLWAFDPPLSKEVSPDEIAQKVCARIYDGVITSELDELAAQICATLVTQHPDYGTLAARIAISNHHKNTSPSFSETIALLHSATDVHNKRNSLISEELYAISVAHKEKLNNAIQYSRDYSNLDYFGFKTLERSYLLKIDGKCVERPQHMWMRVALGIHGWDIKDAIETYELMSQRYFTHATPTLFNAGTPMAQLSSCYLLGIGDSVTGMYKAISDCAHISKYAGGIGVHAHDIRAHGSHIRGTNGTSSGLIPMLRVFNTTARHINQAGKRAGSIAVYLEPWHADIEAFLDIRKNTGAEETRCRDLFSAMWIPDLFMRRVIANETWSLMCPDECFGLSDVYGEDFDKLYESYETAGKFRKQVRAQEIWFAILRACIEGGTPYICYKDAANRTSNQKNLGVIKSSNLCVAPDTLVQTIQGNIPIKDLYDEGGEIHVWNGHEYSLVTIKMTGRNQKLIRVHVSMKVGMAATHNEKSLTCTPYHKFFTKEEGGKHAGIVNANNLTVGDYLVDFVTQYGNKCFDVVVTKIEDLDEVGDTYCFTEPLRHAGIFNGILTGQCSEIIEYSDTKETAVCNLASIALPLYITNTMTYDFERLHKTTQVITRNLEKVINRTLYPIPEAQLSNLRHRPMGIGVQGLADVYAKLRIPFDSDQASLLNKQIFATIYHGALTASMELAKTRHLLYKELTAENTSPERQEEILRILNMTDEEMEMASSEDAYPGAYSTFNGSPASKGDLQFDLWNTKPLSEVPGIAFDWNGLKADIKKYGIRNSLLTALMPTASTSQILGFNEAMEPFTSNIYQRQTLAGEFTIINKYLLSDLIALGIWSPEIKNKILAGAGSIQHIKEIPEELRALYKTVWEIKQKVLIDQAADRGIYVCQSQSLNLFAEDIDFNKLSSMHIYAWRRGLITGCYYLRTRPKARISAYTLDTQKPASPTKEDAVAAAVAAVAAAAAAAEAEAEAAAACRRDNPGACLMCSS